MNERQSGLRTNAIHQLVPPPAIRRLVGAIVEFEDHHRIKRRPIAEDKINAFGEHLTDRFPARAAAHAGFDIDKIGKTNLDENAVTGANDSIQLSQEFLLVLAQESAATISRVATNTADQGKAKEQTDNDQRRHRIIRDQVHFRLQNSRGHARRPHHLMRLAIFAESRFQFLADPDEIAAEARFDLSPHR